MLNANEMRKITEEKLLELRTDESINQQLETIAEFVLIRAESGFNNCFIQAGPVTPNKLILELEELGYDINMTSMVIEISW